MRIHLISIGGAAMHNIGIALKENGHVVSGSDDEIYEPSRTRLEIAGLLPEKQGWDDQRISKDIDLIILGMHAKQDNPELQKAMEHNIPVMSFPEYIYEHAKLKKRVVVAGSHGKTSTTSMIMHVLKVLKYDFDYLVGAQIEGFNTMARFSDAPLIIIEGDEYLSSALDRRPKMLHYKPNLAVITGIAWDHINVFPTFENYLEQFSLFLHSIEKGGSLFYYEHDDDLKTIISNYQGDLIETHAYEAIQTNENHDLIFGRNVYKTHLFGSHNRQNMMAALNICVELGIKPADFFAAMASFKGANKRLQLIRNSIKRKVYLDFAHAPSKVKATIAAVAERYPEKQLSVILELHTYSSLTPAFLKEYNGSLKKAHHAFVFIDPHSLKKKNIRPFTQEELRNEFNAPELIFLEDAYVLAKALESLKNDEILLLMSSGKFGNIDLEQYL